MNEPRDSEDGAIEKEKTVAGQSDAHAPDKGSEGYGVQHLDRVRQRQRQGNGFPQKTLKELPFGWCPRALDVGRVSPGQESRLSSCRLDRDAGDATVMRLTATSNIVMPAIAASKGRCSA